MKKTKISFGKGREPRRNGMGNNGQNMGDDCKTIMIFDSDDAGMGNTDNSATVLLGAEDVSVQYGDAQQVYVQNPEQQVYAQDSNQQFYEQNPNQQYAGYEQQYTGYGQEQSIMNAVPEQQSEAKQEKKKKEPKAPKAPKPPKEKNGKKKKGADVNR